MTKNKQDTTLVGCSTGRERQKEKRINQINLGIQQNSEN